MRWVVQGMDEVLDLGLAMVLPAPAGDALGSLAHVDRARQLAGGTDIKLGEGVVEAGACMSS